jgi:hypothetical protein
MTSVSLWRDSLSDTILKTDYARANWWNLMKLFLSIARYVETRHTMYVQRNIEALSLNHCCSGKAIIITHYESVFEALSIQHANRRKSLDFHMLWCQ